jgi:hypothetical protein
MQVMDEMSVIFTEMEKYKSVFEKYVGDKTHKQISTVLMVLSSIYSIYKVFGVVVSKDILVRFVSKNIYSFNVWGVSFFLFLLVEYLNRHLFQISIW